MAERRTMPTKKVIFSILLILALFSMTSLAMALPDPFATLTVWPYGTAEGAEGPIVTTSPADLVIYNNDNSHVLDDLWLLLVTNSLAHEYLISISTNTSLSFPPEHFEEIPGTTIPSDRIPPTSSDTGTTPTAPYTYRPNGWWGIEWSDQYDVGSLRSQLEVSDGESMWYSVGDLDSSSSWIDHGPLGLNKQDPEYFTITVDFDSEWGGGNWRVLVLALGHTNDYPDDPILNVHSPYTRSTLIVSELGPILLALAPISALGLYRIRHKIRKK